MKIVPNDKKKLLGSGTGNSPESLHFSSDSAINEKRLAAACIPSGGNHALPPEPSID